MNFDLTEEQKMIRDTARDFATREVEPKAASSTRPGAGPPSSSPMAELGFMGMAVPEEHGGAGVDTVSYALAMEEICRGVRLHRRDHERQQLARLRPAAQVRQRGSRSRSSSRPCAAGKKLGCFGLTEPMSGSDASTMATLAEKDGEHWILNGSKNCITNGPTLIRSSCSP